MTLCCYILIYMTERAFIRVKPPSARPGVLDVQDGSRRYQFELQTVHVNEEHEGGARLQAPHEHDVYHVVLFTKGRNSFLLEGMDIPSHPGVLALASPGQPHTFSPRLTGVTRYHEITFSLEHKRGPLRASFARLLSLYTGLSIHDTPLTIELSPPQRRGMEALYEQLIDRLERASLTDWLTVYRTILEILAMIASRVTRSASVEPRADVLTDARDFIEKHYTERLTLPALAHTAHMSEAHFCRAFKARFDAAPIAYQQELRIAAAKNLLLSTNLRCKEIATRLGYADVYCFSKAFKKSTRQSPSDLRCR